LLTDRARQPRWLPAASVVGFAASLAAVALLLGRVPLPVVVAVLLLGGCCGPSLTGGLTSQLSRLVPDASLPRAFGADSLTYNLSGIAGPADAAIVSGAAGAAWRPVRPARTPMTVMVALIVVGVPLAVAAARTPSLALTAILFGISGISLGPFAGALFTTRRYYAPEELQAQVSPAGSAPWRSRSALSLRLNRLSYRRNLEPVTGIAGP
jgi:hypothetical protein